MCLDPNALPNERTNKGPQTHSKTVAIWKQNGALEGVEQQLALINAKLYYTISRGRSPVLL